MSRIKIITGILLILCLQGLSQEKIPPTDKFSIEGMVKKPVEITINELSAYKTHDIDSIGITNHLGVKRGSLKKVKAVLLKEVLNKAEISEENPKMLSEYYLVCMASDNYKVVFSWNEIFNNVTGNFVFLITEIDGKPASLSENRIALVSANDVMTGRRYIKGLQKIIIERAK